LNYYFRYNDILYKTTAVINVGETIVPNTNCAATNIATELEAGGANTDASNVTYDNTDSGLTATNVQDAIDEIRIKTETFTATTSGSGAWTNIATIDASSIQGTIVGVSVVSASSNDPAIAQFVNETSTIRVSTLNNAITVKVRVIYC